MTELEYRDMANEIRGLVPLVIHPYAIADLRSLAEQYERLARYLADSRAQLLSTGRSVPYEDAG
jgi:hypothetical protein